MYRGQMPQDTTEELSRGYVRGNPQPVVYVEDPGQYARSDVIATAYDDQFDVASEEEVMLVGGITPRMGGAHKFANSLSNLGAVQAYQSWMLDPEPTVVEYSLDFMDANPGYWGRIDSLYDIEVRDAQTGDLYGLAQSNGVVMKWGRENLSTSMGSNMYTTEVESFASAERVDTSNAIQGVFTVVHSKRAMGGSMEGALATFDGYRIGSSFGNDINISSLSPEEQAVALHRELRQQMDIRRQPYWLVVMDNDRFWDGNGLDTDEFVLAYDGMTHSESFSSLPDWISQSQ